MPFDQKTEFNQPKQKMPELESCSNPDRHVKRVHSAGPATPLLSMQTENKEETVPVSETIDMFSLKTMLLRQLILILVKIS